MAVLQMISIYLFSIIYSTIPVIVWVGQNEKVSECSHIITHGKNSEKIFAFLGIGIFLPIVMLNILYFVTSCKLRKQWRKRKRFLRQEDSFAKENSCAEMSIMRHINQQRRVKQGEKIKSCDSPKHQPQVQVLLTPSRSEFTDYRPSALLDTTPEPNDLNTSAKPVEVPSSVKTTALPKCESTNFGKNPDPVSTRSGDTPKRFSRLNRGYRSDYQRQSLHLIGLILLLIDVTMFPAIIVRSIPISISFTVRFYLGLVVFNNSLVNPWLYALQSKDLRRALKDNLVKIGGWFACSGGF